MPGRPRVWKFALSVTRHVRSRDEIRAAILEHGWNEKAGAFTQAFSSEDLDASNLMLAITSFLLGDDPRMKATIDVGLLAEEVDVPSGEIIGNFPQAFSHIGLINAAWAISQAQQHAASRGPAAASADDARRRGS